MLHCLAKGLKIELFWGEFEKIIKNMDRQVLEDTIDSWLKHSEMKKYVTLLKLKRRTIKN